MGKTARAFGILALILIAVPIIFQSSGQLIFVGGVLSILAIVLGFLSRTDPDQGAAGKTGMICGLAGLAAALFLVGWLTTSPSIETTTPEMSIDG